MNGNFPKRQFPLGQLLENFLNDSKMTQTDFCLLSVDRYAGERSLTQNTLKRIMLGYNPHGPKRQAVPYNPTPKIVRGIHTVFDRIRGWENAVDLSLFEVYNHRIQEDSTRRDDEDDLGWYTRTAKLTKRLVDEQAVEQLRLLCKHSLAFAPDYGEAEFFNLAGIAGEFAADDYRNGQKGFVSLPKRKGELIMEMRNTGLSPQEQQALMGKLETIVQTYLQTLL